MLSARLVTLYIVIGKVIPDISVLRRHPGLPDVRGDQGPPAGGPQYVRGVLVTLLHPAARQPSPLELSALSGGQVGTQQGVGSPAHQRGTQQLLPRQQ